MIKIDTMRCSISVMVSAATMKSSERCLHAVQKKSQEGINTRLALVMKSGKFTLGTKTCLKCLRSGKGELLVRNYSRQCELVWKQGYQ